jgi:hypothetical protein
MSIITEKKIEPTRITSKVKDPFDVTNVKLLCRDPEHYLRQECGSTQS